MEEGRNVERRDHDRSGGVLPLQGSVSVRVPAKVNLFLAVRGTRPDGYHELVSVMHTLGLFDTVTAELCGTARLSHHPAARRLMDVELAPTAGIPDGDENLVVRAAHRLLDALGASGSSDRQVDQRPRTKLAIHKQIPVGAGMAGGSADAAAALVALNELWDCELDRDELREVAAHLGADVPFCLHGGTGIATGTGTATAQVLARGSYHWVVGISDEPLATADVYRAWDEVAAPSEIEPDAVLHALRTGDAEALGAALHNELQPAAFHLRPGLRAAREAMLNAGAFGAVVSGSGPTIVGLAADVRSAIEIGAMVRECFDRVKVVSSPAGGPEFT